MNLHSSPLVEMAGEAKRPTRWWLAWIVAAVIIMIGSAVGQELGLAVLGSPKRSETLYQFAELFAFGSTLLLLFLWVRLKEGRPITSLGFRGSHAVGKLALGIVLAAAMMTVGVLVAWAIGEYATGASTHTRIGASSLVAIVPLLLVFILQGSTEEVVTRGYMLQTTGRQLGGVAAILSTSIFFGVIHLDFRPVVLLNITLYAVFASFIALEQGNLWLICGIHAGWNFFQGNVFGLPVSGNPEASSFWSFGPASGSHALLSGSDFGLEASLVGTAVLAVATLLAVQRYRRTAATRETALPPSAAAATA